MNHPTNRAASNQQETSIMPDPTKVTVFMRQSLDQLHSSLVCPLCHQMLQSPSTLACAHTFCWKCIEAFSCNNSLCPVKGCGIPLSVTGSRKGSFLKTNPSIETVLSSFQTICQTLDKAPKQWWQHGQDLPEDDDHHNDNHEHETNSASYHRQPRHRNDEDDGTSASSSDEEEMIVLDTTTHTITGNLKNDEEESDDETECLENDGESNWLKQINIDSEDED